MKSSMTTLGTYEVQALGIGERPTHTVVVEAPNSERALRVAATLHLAVKGYAPRTQVARRVSAVRSPRREDRCPACRKVVFGREPGFFERATNRVWHARCRKVVS